MAASSTPARDPFRPAERVSGVRQDVWSMVNEAAAASPIQPIVNMGQGFFGYNPPDFVLDAAKRALDQVECNQYSPTRGRPRLRNALAAAYSPYYGRAIDPDTEITITTGANEGILSAVMGFVEPGDEVIIFEPFFDQYVPNVEMAGGIVKHVAIRPPANGSASNTSAADWTIDMDELERAITPKTRMMILNTPHNPIGKILSKSELTAIANLCVKHSILILSDEVYDALYYKPFERIATLNLETNALTLTVGSAGKSFYCTGWRVGWLLGPANLIKHVAAAHTRICYNSPSPLQEAAAVGFEQAKDRGFWEYSKNDMKARMDRFCSIFDELGLPYSKPEGGYFVLVNFARLRLPEGYEIPEHIRHRPRDFHLSWFLTKEIGVATIPPSEFYAKENEKMAENWLRFAFCKNEDVLDLAKERLRKLEDYLDKT